MIRTETLCTSVAAYSPGKQATAIASGLFGLSFGSALFTLAIFKLLSFFVMPSLFFDLLFIGFPLGALMAAGFLRPGRASLLASLWWLQATMAISIGCCLLAKRFDYLRAHLFDIELMGLVGQLAVFCGLFLPFFAAYGMSEYLGYQYGRMQLGGRMRLVYAMALFGAAAAYLFLRLALTPLGMARILLTAFLAVTGSIAVLGAGYSTRRAAAGKALAIGLLLLTPGLEAQFLALYKGQGIQSTYDFQTRKGCRLVYQKWGRYCLCEILAAPGGNTFYGFYNDMFQWEYHKHLGFTGPSLGAAPILLAQPGSSIAIIGSGGGRQVRLAERLGDLSVTAIELEPAVFDAVRSPHHLLDKFGRVYESSNVRPVRAEARAYFEQSSDRFDLIYLPSVGGYAQMMIEPGNMVRTFEAYRLLRDHLRPRGILAVWYPRGLDTKGVLTSQYVRTLRALGMATTAFRNEREWLILARNGESTPLPGTTEIASLMKLDPRLPESSAYWPKVHDVPPDPDFTPITDDRPYLAGNVRYILSIPQVRILFSLAGGVLAAVGGWVWFALRRRGNPHIPERPYALVGAMALLIGANFLVVEHSLIIALFRKVYVYEDALAIAVVSFLILSGLGSLLADRLSSRMWSPLAGAGAAVLLIAGHDLPLAGVFLAAAPLALVTGTFFPALFDRAAANPLAVFALDAIGAGLGAVLATFVPILWGFSAFFMVAIVLFSVTALGDAWFHARGRSNGSAFDGPDRIAGH